MSDQDRTIKDIFAVRDQRTSDLGRRLANLESAEFSVLNYYGSMSQYNLGTVIAVAASSTFYTITGMSTGLVNGFTFAASQLTCTKAGIYGINYSISLSNMVGNVTRTAARLNGAIIPSTMTRSYMVSAGSYVAHPGTGWVTLAVDDIVELAIANDTDLDDPTIDYASIYLHKLGD